MKYGRVSMFAFVEDWKVFLQERGDYAKRWEEWSFFGGHLEEDEKFLEWCLREVQEELNISIEKEDVILVGEFSNIVHEVSDYLSHVYISKAYQKYRDNIKIQEWVSGRFFTFEQAMKLKIFSHDYMVLDNIQRFLDNEL